MSLILYSPSRLPISCAARLDPLFFLAGTLASTSKLRDEHISFALIFPQPLNSADATELNQSTLAPDNLILLSSAITEPTLRGRGVRASMSSTSELPLPRRSGESVAAEEAADSGKVNPPCLVAQQMARAEWMMVMTAWVGVRSVENLLGDAGGGWRVACAELHG
jgi:hypothetical protein